MRPVRECAVEGCGPKPIKGRGLCGLHYGRLRAYGDPLIEPMRMPKVCTADGCAGQTCALGYCQMHYLRFKKYGDPNARARYWSTGRCTVEGCEREPKGRYCSMHVTRLKRTGTTYLAPRTGRHVTKNGYQVVKRPGHPVARKTGWVLEHRAVLYDAIGEGPHPCHWCGKGLRWHANYRKDADYLVVDHLDNDPSNNDRDNLAPACTPCNTVHSYVIQRVRRSA